MANAIEPFKCSEVLDVFNAYPENLRVKLLELRQLIFDVALNTGGVGLIEETLKWSQPSYLTAETKSGSTIRIDQIKSEPNQYGLFVHCQTSLVSSYRELYGDALDFAGKRGIVFDVNKSIPTEIIEPCVAMALTYHLNKRKDQLPF